MYLTQLDRYVYTSMCTGREERDEMRGERERKKDEIDNFRISVGMLNEF